MGYVTPKKPATEPMPLYIQSKGPAGITLAGSGWGEAPEAPAREPVNKSLLRRVELSGGEERTYDCGELRMLCVEIESAIEVLEWHLETSVSEDGRRWWRFPNVVPVATMFTFSTPPSMEHPRFLRLRFHAESKGVAMVHFGTTN